MQNCLNRENPYTPIVKEVYPHFSQGYSYDNELVVYENVSSMNFQRIEELGFDINETVQQNHMFLQEFGAKHLHRRKNNKEKKKEENNNDKDNNDDFSNSNDDVDNLDDENEKPFRTMSVLDVSGLFAIVASSRVKVLLKFISAATEAAKKEERL